MRKAPFILFFIVLITGCNQKNKVSEEQLYLDTSTNLINDLLADDYDYTCIIEPLNKTLLESIKNDYPKADLEQIISEALSLNSKSELKSLNDRAKFFDLSKIKLDAQKQILLRTYLDSLKSNNKNIRKLIWTNCPDGWITFSRPIFNENYQMAVIEVSANGTIGSILVYKRINGTWKYQKTIFNWLS